MALVDPHIFNNAPKYQRHRPEKTLLYKLVQENLLTFYRHIENEHENGLPQFVKKEFDEFLKCGILAHGFLRTQCESCHHERLVAFSCKRRGFCPSCGARRMAESAAHLVDEVFPQKPLRQWVLSFPFQIRFLFAKNPKVMGEVLAIVHRAISTYLIKRAGLTKKSGAKTGSVTFIQRFGGSINLNIHFHMMYLDGVYTFPEGKPHFHPITPPTQSEMDHILVSIAHRVVKHLEKKGLILRDETGQEYLAMEASDSMDQVHGSSVTYRIALGPHKGKKALTLHTVSPRGKGFNSEFLAKYSGFSLHGGVACRAHEKKKRERVCRYISRPSLSEERLSLNARGQVVYKLKTAYDNGTTHIVLDPLDFLSRLASLIPRPRVNLTRFHGVFAPNFKYRSSIVPQPQIEASIGEDSREKTLDLEDSEPRPNKKKSSGMTWAQRLRRVFDIDVETCHECGGKVKVISSIEDPQVIEKILTHLGITSQPPSLWPPRGPPQSESFDSFS